MPAQDVPTIRRIRVVDPALLPGLAALLIDAIEGGASIGFLAGLPAEAAEAYWRDVMNRLASGLFLWVAEADGVIVGSIQLDPCGKENGRHRAEVQKLFVRRRYRGQGTARRLLATAEEAAKADGRSLLVLDTLKDSDAEQLYERAGWTRAGEIPDYAAHPDGRLHPTVLFYKQLAPAPVLTRAADPGPFP